ncbi:hypothetical protein [Streptomyces sp. NPDC050388]|uniref:hypothetical protein n=1 Tax=Streptomyces sp. NPDC050388 TaxID=3155781 RepID=UPI003415F4B6
MSLLVSDDPAQWLGIEVDQRARDPDVEWQLVVVQALLEDVPVDVFVEAGGIRFASVGDEELVCVAASSCPDKEVADVVPGAHAAGQPVVHVALAEYLIRAGGSGFPGAPAGTARADALAR